MRIATGKRKTILSGELPGAGVGFVVSGFVVSGSIAAALSWRWAFVVLAIPVHSAISSTSAHALQLTFLIMLIPLALNGVFLLDARKSYPTDVATALASEHAVASRRRLMLR